jgi:hypothetical protein
MNSGEQTEVVHHGTDHPDLSVVRIFPVLRSLAKCEGQAADVSDSVYNTRIFRYDDVTIH